MQRCHRPQNKGRSTRWSSGPSLAVVDQLYRLREQGFESHGFEQGDGVGGTWYWNRYPGARCDSEIMYYSFSFMPDLEQEWPLEENATWASPRSSATWNM